MIKKSNLGERNFAEIAFLHRDDILFPSPLREIPRSPEGIFLRGQLPSKPAVAIVGTRKATDSGRAIARQIAEELAGWGFAVISGLAFGIDAAAHLGALQSGKKGTTFAVLGNGLESVYPPSHECLAEKIVAGGGGIISEYPSGAPALPHQFLERNRIVSGLSLAVVVIEAPMKSGAIATASHAAEQGREVFVVPGPSGHINYAGSHNLLRNGTRLAENARQILDDLRSSMAEYPELRKVFGDGAETNKEGEVSFLDDSRSEEERAVLKTLQRFVSGADSSAVAETAELPPNIAAKILTMLTLDGRAEERGGKFYIK